jgi:hypothetical protein
MNRKRSALIWLLRIFGAMATLALPTVLLPMDWMARIHGWLGLGEFPYGGIVGYLARSLSMFYGLVGILILLLSTDVERFRPLIRYAGWGSILAGPILLGAGLAAELPRWWSWHEGPSAAAFGIAVLWLSTGDEEGG